MAAETVCTVRGLGRAWHGCRNLAHRAWPRGVLDMAVDHIHAVTLLFGQPVGVKLTGYCTANNGMYMLWHAMEWHNMYRTAMEWRVHVIVWL
ncbi:hypothetical protein [Paenibacillus lautus]|uniref:hypothetical protein n=1 Tax=Paenibacillus lautus TaxID=1401 RepID=UPI000FD89E52|nr:hypothetical protein [Paenibacillus lautus]